MAGAGVGVTVVDCGCKSYDGEESIGHLAGRFQPDVFYGFDPQLTEDEMLAGVEGVPAVMLSREAAWIADGVLRLGLGSWRAWDATAMREKNGRGEWADTADVPCFDLAAWLTGLPAGEVVLKLDVEGAEFPILRHLITADADLRLSLLLVEWHTWKLPARYLHEQAVLSRALRCPVEPWQT